MLKYLLFRIVIIVATVLLFYHTASFLLPKNYQDDQFSFVAELDVFSRSAVLFLTICLLFFGYETYRFHKKKDHKMRAAGIALMMGSAAAILCLESFILQI